MLLQPALLLWVFIGEMLAFFSELILVFNYMVYVASPNINVENKDHQSCPAWNSSLK